MDSRLWVCSAVFGFPRPGNCLFGNHLKSKPFVGICGHSLRSRQPMRCNSDSLVGRLAASTWDQEGKELRGWVVFVQLAQ